jgi:hypothetical protein
VQTKNFIYSSIHHFHPLVLHCKTYIYCCDNFHLSNDFIHHYTYIFKTYIHCCDRFHSKMISSLMIVHELNGHHPFFSSSNDISCSHVIWWTDTILCCIWGKYPLMARIYCAFKIYGQVAHFRPPSIPWWALCFQYFFNIHYNLN